MDGMFLVSVSLHRDIESVKRRRVGFASTERQRSLNIGGEAGAGRRCLKQEQGFL